MRLARCPEAERIREVQIGLQHLREPRSTFTPQKHVPTLSPPHKGWSASSTLKRLWAENAEFWKDKKLPLQQEIIFASTGVKSDNDPADKYVAALAGSDIQTNPPSTNAAIQKMTGKTFQRRVDKLPPADVLADIDAKVDFQKLEETLMDEGLKKFADPQKALVALIGEKRKSLKK